MSLQGNRHGSLDDDDDHHAIDGLVNLLTKANNDLTVVHNRLDKEFRQIYPDNANPMKLVARIKKIQDELPSLKEQCRELLSAKQDLIDKARTTIVGNRASLQRLQTSMGIPVTNDSDDPAYTNFNEVIDEWTLQVRSKTGDEGHEDSGDINRMLFSAIVHGKITKMTLTAAFMLREATVRIQVEQTWLTLTPGTPPFPALTRHENASVIILSANQATLWAPGWSQIINEWS